MAGSYDNEGIAIFCMLFTYYLWIKSVKTGNIYWAALCSVAYFYMVSSWGGYVFLINIIPIHVFVLMVSGRFSHRLYIAYSTVSSSTDRSLVMTSSTAQLPDNSLVMTSSAGLLPGHAPLNADLVCWLPARPGEYWPLFG